MFQYYGIPKQELVGYVRNTESINMVLSSLDLFHEFPNLPITTRICDIFATITEKLKERYVISEPPQLPSGMAFPTQDQLPLQILAWTNRGRANGKYKTPKLTTASFSTNTSVRDLLQNVREYATKVAISEQSHFQIYASKLIFSPSDNIVSNIFYQSFVTIHL